MLSVVSKSKSPKAVQKELHKIFESNFNLVFDEQERIVALDASEEKVKLLSPVETKNVRLEEWIGELEKVMKLSIKEAIKDVLHSCPKELS